MKLKSMVMLVLFAALSCTWSCADEPLDDGLSKSGPASAGDSPSEVERELEHRDNTDVERLDDGVLPSLPIASDAHAATSTPNLVEVKMKVVGYPLEHAQWGHALAVEGDQLVAFAPDPVNLSDSTYHVLRRNNEGVEQWGEAAFDRFEYGGYGTDAALDGQTAAVSNLTDGKVHIFYQDTATHELRYGDDLSGNAGEFGASISLQMPLMAIGDTASSSFGGSVGIYESQDPTYSANWLELTRIWHPNESDVGIRGFGWAVDLDGETMAVGAPMSDTPSAYEAGLVYIFESATGDPTSWTQVKRLTDPNPLDYEQFGSDVALDGDTLVVAADQKDYLPGPIADAGEVLIFERDQGGTDNWGQVALIRPPQPVDGDRFGDELALSGDYLVVGVPYHDGETGEAHVYGRDVGGTNAWGLISSVGPSAPQTGVRFGEDVDIDAKTIGIGAPMHDDTYTDQGAVYVWALNLPPVGTDDSATTPEESSLTLDVAANDIDPDGDPLSVTQITATPSNGQVSINSNGTVTYSPATNFVGTDTFTYEVRDSKGATSTAQVTITVENVNDAPVTTNDSAQVDEDQSVKIDVLANDTDVDGDSLTVSNLTTPANGQVHLETDQSITYEPVDDFNGTDSFSYQVSDPGGLTDTATVEVTVNPIADSPTAVDDRAACDEDTQVTVSVLGNDSDPDGDSFDLSSVVQNPANGSASINSDSTITYTPDADFSGNDRFVYSIQDSTGRVDEATVAISVNAVNDDPIANPETVSLDEDTSVTIDVLANDEDADDDSLEVFVITSPMNGLTTIDAVQRIRYVPDPNFHGSDQLRYAVSDGNGGSSSALVSITVNSVPDAPTAIDDVGFTDEETPVAVTVLANDNDPDGDSLTVTVDSGPANGTASVQSDGTIEYTPATDYAGTDELTYRVEDETGVTDTARLRIYVDDVNDAPSAEDDALTVGEDDAATIDVLSNDVDVDDELTVEITTPPTHGTVSVDLEQLVTYKPTADYNGSDSFQYQAADGRGGADTATVAVTVEPVEDPPTAVDDSARVDENSSGDIDVLANDWDPDGDELQVSIFSEPSRGDVEVNDDQTLTYSPERGFDGSDSFAYEVVDPGGQTAQATVTIDIPSNNAEPIAEDDEVSTEEEVPVTIDLLANDTDPDGDALELSILSTTENGSATRVEDGRVTYIPNAGFTGTDTFNYQIDDGLGHTDDATVTVEVRVATSGCVTDSDCSAGTACRDRLCVATCDTNADCAAPGTVCQEGICMEGEAGNGDGDSDTSGNQEEGCSSAGNSGGPPASWLLLLVAVFFWIRRPARELLSSAALISVILLTVGCGDNDPAHNSTIRAVDVGFQDTEKLEEDVLDWPSATSHTQAATSTPVLLEITRKAPPSPQLYGDFGRSVAAGGDQLFALDRPDSGVASYYLFSRNQGGTEQWGETATGSGPSNTSVVAPIVFDAPTVATQGGSGVYVFHRDSTTGSVSHIQTLTSTNATSSFGSSIGLDGSLLAAGNPAIESYPQFVVVFESQSPSTSSNWGEIAQISAPNDSDVTVSYFGSAVALDADTMVVGAQSTDTSAAEGAGVAYVFQHATGDPSTWNRVKRLEDPNANFTEQFGNAVALDADTIAVGAQQKYYPAFPDRAGAVFIYERDQGGTDNWGEVAMVTSDVPADGEWFGETLALSGDYLVVGAPQHNGTDTNTGMVYVFGRNVGGTSAWGMFGKMEASTQERGMEFGRGLDLDGTTIGIGAPNRDGTYTDEGALYIWEIDRPPTAAADQATTPEETPVTIDLLANDSDPEGDPFTLTAITATPSNGGVTDHQDGTVTYTPFEDFVGTDTFSYEVTDSKGASSTGQVEVTVDNVNDAPTANYDTAQVDEDLTTNIDVRANDEDVDGDTLLVSLVTQPANGQAIVETNQTITYTPNANFNGSDTFDYMVTDPGGLSDTETIDVTVSPVPDSPVAADDTASCDEDADVTISVLTNDSDPDGDTFSITSVLQHPSNGTSIVNPDGTVTYTPAEDFAGTDSFTYEIEDSTGRVDDATVAVAVTNINDPPRAVSEAVSLDEDKTVVIDILANDSDEDGDSLTAQIIAQPSNGTVSLNAQQQVTYTPAAHFHGTDSFSYEISDGNGATDTAEVSILVHSVPDAPVATDDTATTDEETSLTVDVLSNDADPDGDTLTVSIASSTDHGTASVQGDKTIHYIPETNYSGPDELTYQIRDEDGVTDTARLYITVTDVNDQPIVEDDTLTVEEDTSGTVNVLSNDMDIDDALIVEIETSPSNGVVTVDSSQLITYEPDANFNGSDSFEYRASDGRGGSEVATVEVTVLAVNDSPDAADDSAEVDENDTVVIEVLINDTDPDGDALEMTIYSRPSRGTVEVNEDKTIRYTPNLGFDGTDSFSYQIEDPSGATDRATVSIEVPSTNAPPVAEDDEASTEEDVPVVVDLLANDTDPDGDALEVAIVSTTDNGSASVSAEGDVTYSPNAGFTGLDSFTYQVDDGQGHADQASVTVEVRSALEGCSTDQDCAAGTGCYQGTCLTACETDANCSASGTSCLEGVCRQTGGDSNDTGNQDEGCSAAPGEHPPSSGWLLSMIVLGLLAHRGRKR